MPTTRSRPGVLAPMPAMESDEVLEARTASARTCFAVSAKTSCLTFMFSTMASITRSARPKPEKSSVGSSRPILRFDSGTLSRRRFTCLSNSSAACTMPLARASSRTSFMRTGRLVLSAMSWAMPPPMTPAPSTAVDFTCRGSAPGRPVSFLAFSVRWKTCSRFFEIFEVASSAAARASASKPALTPCSMPSRTTSMARSGAG